MKPSTVKGEGLGREQTPNYITVPRNAPSRGWFGFKRFPCKRSYELNNKKPDDDSPKYYNLYSNNKPDDS